MSIQNRKIGYFSIDFEDGDKRSFDAGTLKRLLEYISSLSGKDRIITDKKLRKAVDVESIEIYEKQGVEFAKIVFKSCKYNHSPNYMSIIDGSERPSDKKLTEGEKECTHMFMRFDTNEAYTIFEERRAGVSMQVVVEFFNKNLNKLRQQGKLSGEEKISFGYIPSENFLELVDNSERIVAAELFTEREVLGSDYLNLLELDDNSREEIIITVKAKPRESLTKRALKGAYNMLASEGSKVSRIRLYTKDFDNLNVLVDTNEAKKIKEINVELRKDGTVNTDSIFSKMEEIFGVTE